MSGQCKKCGYDGCVCDGTDTPETDKIWDDLCDSWANWSVNYAHQTLLDYARKLERERDEARKLAEFYLTTLSHGNSVYIGMKLPWETLNPQAIPDKMQ